jgi:acetolactate synthase-1/2/3 large subunit
MSSKTTADLMTRSLAQLGIESVYVYPGGTIAPLVNGFVAAGVGIEVFKHEQGAVYAALAKARLTGQLQIAMVTSGPGVTNAITPLADAYYDSTPLLLITGQVGTGDLLSGRRVRQRGFQEVPTVSMVSDICKMAVCPATVDEALAQLPALIQAAMEGRPGPVVMDLPMDVQRAVCERLDLLPLVVQQPALPGASLQALGEISAALAQATRPVIMLGHGALTAAAFDGYEALAEKLDAYVVGSLPGLGAFPGTSERFLGYVGHTGHEAANRAVHEADFLLVLGARLDIRQTGSQVKDFVPQGKVAWVNNDRSEIDAPRVQVDWAVHGDVAQFVQALLARHKDQQSGQAQHSDAAWRADVAAHRARDVEDPFNPAPGSAIFPKEVLRLVNQKLGGTRGVVVTGVGSHQQWAARHIDYSPNGWRLLTSAGHGAMGYDVPTAVGAAMARPDQTVLCVVGDGSLLMNIQELASLAERKLNVKVLLLNNHRLGIVSQFQRITWGVDPSSGEFATPDFVTIAKGFGISAERVTARGDLVAGLDRFWSTPGPALIEVIIDHDADVVPMLLGGQTMDKMWQGYAA